MSQAAIIQFEKYYKQAPENGLNIVKSKKTVTESITTRKSYGLNSLAEIKEVMDCMLNNNMYIHYLIFGIQLNTGRRISDIIGKKNTKKSEAKSPMKWSDFFAPNGKRKSYILVKEKKTGKFKEISLNKAFWKVIDVYCENTGCDPTGKNYDDYITLQLHGTHKGRILTYEAHRSALEKIQKECGIERKFRSHSSRKSVVRMMLELNPTDPFAMSIASSFLNHSSEAITRGYAGIDEDSENKYIESFGDAMLDVMEGKEIAMPDHPTDLITIEYDDLRQIIQLAYQCGRENALENDLQKHLDNIDVTMEMIRDAMK